MYAHWQHDIGAGQDVILPAAGEGALIPVHGHHCAVQVELEGQRVEPVGVVKIVLVADGMDFKPVSGNLGAAEVQNEAAFIESGIAGAEITVQHRGVGHGS